MARAAGTRAASAKPAPAKEVKVNGTAIGMSSSSHCPKPPLILRNPARRAKTEAPLATNGTAEESEHSDSEPEPEPVAKREQNASQ
jgi:regulator of chromosome condensation